VYRPLRELIAGAIANLPNKNLVSEMGATMSYVYELDSELPDVFIDNQGTSIVEFAIGYDLDESEIVLFSVTLGPSVDGASDLRFGTRAVAGR